MGAVVETTLARSAAHAVPGPGLSRLSLLGGFEATFDGRLLPLPQSAERVVAFLALNDRPLSRAYVSGTLWPETTDERAGANLRSALWRLRRVGDPLVETTGTHLRLGRAVVVDVREVSRLMRKLMDRAATPRVRSLGAIFGSADLLPGWYEDWVLAERERLRQLRLRTLQTLCERYTALGRFGAAVDAGLAAVNEEPLRESAHRALIRAHLAEGNVAEALHQYRRYRHLLFEELGLKPSPEMQDLIGAVGGA